MSQETLLAKPKMKPPSGSELMEGIWDEAAQEFNKICGKSLEKGKLKSWNDVRKVIENIEKAPYNDDSNKDAWDRAKDAGIQVLNGLSLLTSLTSNVASFLPVPEAATTLTASALSWVFSVPAKVQGYDEAVDQVFGKMSSVLSRCRIYKSMTTVNKELASHIRPVTISVIKLCAYVVKHRQGGLKPRMYGRMEAILTQDTNLDTEMKTLQALLKQQDSLEGTITLGEVLKISGVTEETNENVKMLINKLDLDETLDKIRNALDIDSRVRFDNRTTQTRIRLSEQCYEGTGSWIWKNEQYLTWVAIGSGQEKRSRMLLLLGPPCSGKTLVSAAITKHLEEQKEVAFVAHYFFSSIENEGRPDAERHRHTARNALKFMAFQLAKVDPTLRRSLSRTLGNNGGVFNDSKNLKELWQQLGIGKPMPATKSALEAQPRSATKYYLVFDGLDHLPEGEGRELLNLLSSLMTGEESASVRILVTGNGDMFKKPATSQWALRINIQEQNEEDMHTYIKVKLDEARALQYRSSNQEQKTALDMILDSLPGKSSGSFSTLQYELDETIRQLHSGMTLGQLAQVLDGPAKSHHLVLRKLQESLTEGEIIELNELLRWVLFSPELLSLEELQAAMFLSSETKPIVTLEEIIRSKYLGVFDMRGRRPQVLSSIAEHLDRKDLKDLKRSEATSSISMTITINNADPKICGHFFWDLASKTVRDDFRDDFMKVLTAAHSGVPAIGVEEFEVHRKIITMTFAYLIADEKTETKELGKHLLRYLPYRLSRLDDLECEDIGSLSPNHTLEIGLGLYQIFTDCAIVNRHQASFEGAVWSKNDVEVVKQWLTRSHRSISKKKTDSKWNDICQQSNPTDGFLGQWTAQITYQFLRTREWQAKSAYAWVENLMGMGLSSVDKGIPYTDRAHWERVSAWCQNRLGLEDADVNSLWYERLGQAVEHHIPLPPSKATTYGLMKWYGPWQKAQRIANIAEYYYTRALMGPSRMGEKPSWLCHRGLSRMHARPSMWDHGGMVEANKALEHAKRALHEAYREEASPKATRAEIGDLNFLAGDCATAAGDLLLAAYYYERASRDDGTNQATHGKLKCLKARLRLARSKQTKTNTDKAREMLLATMAGEQQARSTTAVAIWKRIALEDDRDDLIGQIFTFGRGDTRLFDGFVNIMQVAIDGYTPAQSQTHSSSAVVQDDLSSFAENEALGILLYYRGIASCKYQVPAASGDNNNIDQALKSWRGCREILVNVGGRNALKARADASAELAKHYFQEIRELYQSLNADSERSKTMQEILLQNTNSPLCRLRELDKSSSRASYSDTAALLAAAYHLIEDTKRSKRMLTRWLKPALDILNDDIPENDVEGIAMIARIMANHGHLKDQAIAMSLLGQPDLVSNALSFDIEDIIGVDANDKDRRLDYVTRLAERIVRLVKSQVPDVSQQGRRIKVAVNHVESLMTEAARQDCFTAAGGAMRDVGNGDPRESVVLDPHVSTARRLVHDRLADLEQKHTPKLNPRAFQSGWTWSCDGRASDGQHCRNVLSFDRALYRCIYCRSKDFCMDCLQRLRQDDNTSAIITACSPDHSWMKLEPWGTDRYRGLGAKILQVPILTRLADDPMIWEICYAESREITLEDWKRELAAKCA